MNKRLAILSLLLASMSAHASDECGSDFICFKKAHPTEEEAKTLQLAGDNLRAVKAHAEHLKKHPQMRITVAGYTSADECGTSCDALAQRRAQIGYDGLVALGIEKTRIDIRPSKDVQKLNSETLKRHPDDEHSALLYMHD